MEIAIVLGLLALVIILFSTELLPPDVVTLGVLVVLGVMGILSVKEVFAGFGSDFIMMLASIFVLCAALQQNGMIDLLIERMSRLKSMQLWVAVSLVMLVTGFVSAFMNNTTVAAVFVPAMVALSRTIKVSPSKLLMPMAFAALLGGTCTLVGTSTNVAGSGFFTKIGLGSIGLFEFLPVGLVFMAVGTLFMATIGLRMLPNKVDNSYIEKYDIRKYLSEVLILPNSNLINKPIFELNRSIDGIRILKMIRNKQEEIFPNTTTIARVDDLVLVEADRIALANIRRQQGIEILGATIQDENLESLQIKLAEALVLPNSFLVGKSAKEADFRKRYHLSVLAIHRHAQNLSQKVGSVPLKAGDVLLVQGPQTYIDLLQREKDLRVISEIDHHSPPRLAKGWLTLALFGLAVLLSAFDLIPAGITFLAASVLAIIANCIEKEAAYNAIEWHLLVLIGGMVAFGEAMQKTGTDLYLAEHIVSWLGQLGVKAVLFGFMLLTVLLTIPMTNAAAALVVLPIAIATANTLGVNPRTFGIAVIISASISVVAPFEPACLLVYGPGQYRIKDFIKIGGILTILLLAVLLVLVPIFWPL
ncbi:MAG: SLC13 family permease [Sphingobacteriales bacterium]|jgi:di/tricarboxylate transporter|nr:SLC13 family permease [Sphingobacteriales bacterium]MBP9142180.1 SLC13 family permease [Chitinophagales bacterium]MDA0197739.1 SLC13 family permease [Bacteroidota bacterium]MBK6891014.1 SLC13 family permease [Sphingobacteriales bacterium]MBK7527156.1 SLC13 family permease [Sphingobacteriales bacterium]